jgi:hypothetical protein
MTVSVHVSLGSISRLGETPRPLLANRNRRMCGMSRRRSPMYSSCSGSRRYVSPPETTMSRSDGVFSMYSNRGAHFFGCGMNFFLWSTSLVPVPTV